MQNIRFYHITHINNLKSILETGFLYSDKKRHSVINECQIIGNAGIKNRRLTRPVLCYDGTYVGEYVPFYFCPRSIMLFNIHTGRVEQYTERQYPIIHLEFELEKTINWADTNNKKWAFTDFNASAPYAQFSNQIEDLEKLNWKAIHSEDFSNASGNKEAKQAEFLIYEEICFSCVKKIGVYDTQRETEVKQLLGETIYNPVVSIEKEWYF